MRYAGHPGLIEKRNTNTFPPCSVILAGDRGGTWIAFLTRPT